MRTRITVVAVGVAVAIFAAAGAPERANAVAGSPDRSFSAESHFGGVHSLLPLPGGGVLIGGGAILDDDGIYGGVAMLDPTGSLIEPGFGITKVTGGTSGVLAIAPTPDGKYLIGGTFEEVDGVARRALARLEANGTVDTSFNAEFVSGSVFDIAIQPEGKVLVVKSTPANGIRLSRLNPDGSNDETFIAPTINDIYRIALDGQGRIIAAGTFTGRITRLSAEGVPDPTFVVPAINGPILHMAVQADSKIVAAGSFTTVGGVGRNGIAKLAVDGSLDTGFTSAGIAPGWSISALAVAGPRTLVGIDAPGSANDGFLPLDGTGNPDITFLPGRQGLPGATPTSLLRVVAVGPTGHIYLGGGFDKVGGFPTRYAARLHGGSLRPASLAQSGKPLFNKRIVARRTLKAAVRFRFRNTGDYRRTKFQMCMDFRGKAARIFRPQRPWLRCRSGGPRSGATDWSINHRLKIKRNLLVPGRKYKLRFKVTAVEIDTGRTIVAPAKVTTAIVKANAKKKVSE